MPRAKTETFGAALRRLRAAAGLTQGELAERAATGREHVADLERGAKEPGLDLLRRLVAALGCDPREFFP